MTLDTDLASFDEAAFKSRLASTLDDVTPADISLVIKAGSLIVTATIRLASTSAQQLVSEAVGSFGGAATSTMGHNLLLTPERMLSIIEES